MECVGHGTERRDTGVWRRRKAGWLRRGRGDRGGGEVEETGNKRGREGWRDRLGWGLNKNKE